MSLPLTYNSPYVPARQGWAEGAGRPSPLKSNPHSPTHRRTSSGDNYYEDVDPRFAEPIQPVQELSAVPAALIPGYNNSLPGTQTTATNHDPGYLHPSSFNPALALDSNQPYEDIAAEGSRSPAESERSNFTSVSQRGVNPRWNGGPGNMAMPPSGGDGHIAPLNTSRKPVPPPAAAVAAQRNEMVLNSNPDFELPGAGAGRSARQGSRDVIGRRPLPPGASVGASSAVGAGMVPRSAYEGRAL